MIHARTHSYKATSLALMIRGKETKYIQSFRQTVRDMERETKIS
jgi:hypothetical protein